MSKNQPTNVLSSPKKKLMELNLQLPEVSTPGGSYVSVNIRGKMAFVAVQFPILNGKYLFQGKLGQNLTTDEGYQAMQLCALNVLAQMESKVGFDYIEGLNHIDAYYRASVEWDDAPMVVNGASDLFLKVLGEQGVHARAIFGVEHLPREFGVGLTASFTIK